MPRYARPRAVLATSGLAVGLAASLAAGGCGGATQEPTIASADSAPGATQQAAAPTVDPLAAYVDGRRTWVACMREQGFALPDPDPTGEVDMRAIFTSAKAKANPRFQAAITACQPVDPTIPPQLRPTEEPLSPEQLKNRQAYATCMRANGMPGFPDPGPDGEFAVQGELSAQENAANERAVQICDPVLGGQPPASYDPDRKVGG